jgi:hypothetical protein
MTNPLPPSMLLGIQNLNLPNSALTRVSISGRSNWLTCKLDYCNPAQTVVLPDTREPEQATFIKQPAFPIGNLTTAISSQSSAHVNKRHN